MPRFPYGNRGIKNSFPKETVLLHCAITNLSIIHFSIVFLPSKNTRSIHFGDINQKLSFRQTESFICSTNWNLFIPFVFLYLQTSIHISNLQQIRPHLKNVSLLFLLIYIHPRTFANTYQKVQHYPANNLDYILP